MSLELYVIISIFFFSSRRRHTRWPRDWSSDVCSSDLLVPGRGAAHRHRLQGLSAAVLASSQARGRRRGGSTGSRPHLRRRSEERRVGKECRSRRWAQTKTERRTTRHEEAEREK